MAKKWLISDISLFLISQPFLYGLIQNWRDLCRHRENWTGGGLLNTRKFQVLLILQMFYRTIFFTQGQFWPLGIVIDWVWLCVHVYVCPELVQAITCNLLKPVSPNMDQRYKTPRNKIVYCFREWFTLTSRSNLTSKSLFHYVRFVHHGKYTTIRVNT